MATYLFLADYEALSKTVNVPPEKRNLSGKFRKLRPSSPKKGFPPTSTRSLSFAASSLKWNELPRSWSKEEDSVWLIRTRQPQLWIATHKGVCLQISRKICYPFVWLALAGVLMIFPPSVEKFASLEEKFFVFVSVSLQMKWQSIFKIKQFNPPRRESRVVSTWSEMLTLPPEFCSRNTCAN